VSARSEAMQAQAAASPVVGPAIRSIDALLAEVARVEEAAREEVRAGVTPGAPVGTRLWVTGAWSPGQIFQHVARAVERSFQAAPPGTRFDHDSADLAPDAQVWTEVGADQLRRALARIGRGERMTRGGIGHEEWLAIHLRHAEEHLEDIHMTV
jgi:hypothetical protein